MRILGVHFPGRDYGAQADIVADGPLALARGHDSARKDMDIYRWSKVDFHKDLIALYLFLGYSAMHVRAIAGSSNGRIAVSETVHLGSNPSPAARKITKWYKASSCCGALRFEPDLILWLSVQVLFVVSGLFVIVPVDPDLVIIL
jgi:hypothetical protein